MIQVKTAPPHIKGAFIAFKTEPLALLYQRLCRAYNVVVTLRRGRHQDWETTTHVDNYDMAKSRLVGNLHRIALGLKIK